MSTRRDFLQKFADSFIALPFLSRYGSAVTKNFYKPFYECPVLRVAIKGLGSYGTRVAEAMKDGKQVLQVILRYK